MVMSANMKMGNHITCSNECKEVLDKNPDFDCFDDGCEYECCACGACSNIEKCPETGKGLVWHP